MNYLLCGRSFIGLLLMALNNELSFMRKELYRSLLLMAFTAAVGPIDLLTSTW